MKLLPILGLTSLLLFPVGALADEKPTPEQAEKIAAALAAQGCQGGEMEVDDGKFEVDDAKCADGEYDFELDKDFNIISKKKD